MPSDSDLREIEEIIKPSDSALDADGEAGGSLTTDESISDPRKAFLDNFTSDTPEETEENEEKPKDDEDDDTDVESHEDEPADDADETSPKQSDSDDDDEEDEDDDDDEDIDTGVDLSDLDLDDDEDQDDEEEFNPRSDLAKKVWKATPKAAQELISSHRRHAKRLEKRIKQDSQYADWTKNLFKDAEKAHTPKEQMIGLIEAGFRLNSAAAAGRKDPETAKIFGEIALANGFDFELEVPELDLDPIKGVLQQKIDDGEMPLETANDILRTVQANAAQFKEAATKAPRKVLPPVHERDWQDPDQLKHDEAVRDAVVQKIATMTKRFKNQFGDNWTKLEKRILEDLNRTQQATPQAMNKWPKMWKEAAEKVTKAYLKRSKERKGRNRLQGGSESLGRGSSVNVGDNSSDTTGDPRRSFLDQYTK